VLRILFEVFERLNELLSSEFTNPVVVCLPFKRRTRDVCIGFIRRVHEITVKRETRKVEVLPTRNWVCKEVLQCVSFSTMHNID